MSTDPSAGRLTTTSYALLGLLAIKPWTTYELARLMTRSLDRLWPRARSKLYEEPKKLVAHGLATATTETVGRRPRTVYAITDHGRAALAQWLAAPSQPPAVTLESEQLLKVFFADHGSKQALVATLAGMRAWAQDQLAEHAAVARAYQAGLGPFPERAAVLALTGRFLADFAEMVNRWADWATTTAEAWPDDLAAAEPDWATFRDVARRAPEKQPPQQEP
jgi:PadR family transcriptional regulator, regulatory protein AphA